MKTGTPAKATIETKLPDSTVWLVQWPSTRKAVYAITSHGTDQILLQTRTGRQPVGSVLAARITATVRAAIRRASV